MLADYQIQRDRVAMAFAGMGALSVCMCKHSKRASISLHGSSDWAIHSEWLILRFAKFSELLFVKEDGFELYE